MTKQSTVIAGVVSMFIILTLSGCMDTVNTAENTDKSMRPNFIRTTRVVTDGYLERRLKVLRADTVTLDDGLLKTQVTLKSTRVGFWDWLWHGDAPYKVSYRWVWLDKDGMVVDTAASTWVEKDILPGDTVWLSSVAPNERCKDFYLKLKEL
jgi:hypothetical protein